MDSPRLALRFRDPSTSVRTVDEHRKILEQKGIVWWGWWKKDTEDLPADLINGIGEAGCTILLVNRSLQQCFRARCIKATLASAKRPSANDIPRYYRRILTDVPVWFLLSSIEPVDYQEGIARDIGDRTILSLVGGPKATPSRLESITSKDRDTVLHLSDLHFGKDHGFRPPGSARDPFDQKKTLVDSLMQDLARCKAADRIGAIVVTGDITTQGDWNDATMYPIVDELQRLARGLSLEPAHIVLVPGNHDIIRQSDGSGIKGTINDMKDYAYEREFRNFADRLTGRFLRGSLNKVFDISLQNANLQLCALNSCRVAGFDNWTEYGYVGDGGIDALQDLAEAPVVRPTYRGMALHHHLLPVAQVEVASADRGAPNGVSLTIDAVKLLEAAAAADVHVALHGHQHIPRVTEYCHYIRSGTGTRRRLIIASAGSASVQHSRLPLAMRNTYSLLKLHADHAHLSTRELLVDGSPGNCLIEEVLPVKPLQP